MHLRLLGIVLAAAGSTLGQHTFELGRYRLTRTFDLPAAASEASAIAFNRDTGNLLVLGDEGEALVEVTREGAVVSTMTLTGFDDTEGLTYIGGGQFVIAEERLQDLFRVTYVAGGTVDRSAVPGVSLGETVGNIGIEGVTFDPITGRYFAVKEKTPQAVLSAQVDFGAGSAGVSSLFAPNLGLLDLSDVQALSVIPSLGGSPDAENLLIYSQESGLLLEVTRGGNVQAQVSLASVSTTAEGVTVDNQGVIYVCDETPRVFVLEPCLPDCNADGVLNLGDFGCFQTRFALEDPYADCNRDFTLNLGDFGCFQTQFALGCP